jgi:ketosteroid isomerase-like protein
MDEIRELIERWVTAVHTGDLATVLADHADDVVMFDVPPPYDGVRGLTAYAESWPDFFNWQASGASFELTSLDITEGTDVAFAVALLKCGMPDETPGRRLRLTIGLRKLNDRWTVAHEHHSFPHDDIPSATGESAVRGVLDSWTTATARQDLDALMADIAPDIVSYEHAGPLQYVGREAVREVCATGLETPAEFTTPDHTILARDNLAVAWGIDHVASEGDEITSRATRVFHHTDDGWKLIHQHLSFPQ